MCKHHENVTSRQEISIYLESRGPKATLFQRGRVKEQMRFDCQSVPPRWQEETVKAVAVEGSSQCQWTMSPTSVSCQRDLHPPIQQLGQPRTEVK